MEPTEVRIAARDGTVLSANLWLPAGAGADAPVPAILEMIPYRKDDWRANADAARGRYLAERGYALCRLDVRGTGRSGGVALDEYTADETRDGYDAVEWLAAQPWCSGRVGMWGISYGGFTAIQVAALRPPHLGAIAPMYATDDRYTDDVHYVGGCLTASELTQYAVAQVATNALPPLPARADEDWQGAWRARLEATPTWLIPWLQHQVDGPYWRQGSLAPAYDRIAVPMLLFGGWMDSYVDPVFRMLERCTAPRRAIVGNWSHEFPDDGYPGPNLDWLHEMVRFFDATLRGVDNGALDEPALAWYERDWAVPEPFPATWPGRWRAIASAARVSGRPGQGPGGTLVLHLDGTDVPLAGRLAASAGLKPGAAILHHRSTTGTRGGLSWGAGGSPNGLARDVRPDEADVPVYVSDAVEAPMTILGRPVLDVLVESSMPVATLVVRLSDVAPDGRASQVTAGVLNLTHRDGHAEPVALPVGEPVRAQVPLRATGYRVAPGHRLRLSVASSCWPVLWPSPQVGTLRIHHGPEGSRLELPLAPPEADDARVPVFRTELPDLVEVGNSTADPPRWEVVEDVLAGTVTVRTHDGGASEQADGSRLYGAESHELTASDADPARARMLSIVRNVLDRDGHRVEVDVRSELSSDADAIHLDLALDVALDGRPFFARHDQASLPRRLV